MNRELGVFVSCYILCLPKFSFYRVAVPKTVCCITSEATQGRQLQQLACVPYEGTWLVGSFGIRAFFVSTSHCVLVSTESSATTAPEIAPFICHRQRSQFQQLIRPSPVSNARRPFGSQTTRIKKSVHKSVQTFFNCGGRI